MSTAPFPQLQAFLAVARLHGFSAAARELGVSRSAVSQAVQQLEQQLEVVLLTRTTRSVSLTDAGRRLVDGAGPALRQALSALDEVAARPGETVGRMRLSVPRAALGAPSPLHRGGEGARRPRSRAAGSVNPMCFRTLAGHGRFSSCACPRRPTLPVLGPNGERTWPSTRSFRVTSG